MWFLLLFLIKLGAVRSEYGENVSEAPTVITDTPEHNEVTAGSSATFRCNAIADESLKLEIIWLSDGKQIDFESQPRFRITNDYSLLISDTTELDSGEYTCIARTAIDEARAHATLTVHSVQDSHSKETATTGPPPAPPAIGWSPIGPPYRSSDPYNRNRLLLLFGIVFLSTGIMFAAIKGFRKKTLENTSDASGTDVVFNSAQSTSTTASACYPVYETSPEHVYETIPEPLYDEPISNSSSNRTPASERNISERPPYPLPPEAQEVDNENVPYRHYDTPYESRIGVPVTQWPDRFGRRGNQNDRRCSE